MSKLFVSYRRDDSADLTGRLHEKLEGHFGPGTVYMDINATPLGVDFRKHFADEVNQCDVLLAVIGDRWLDAAYQDGPKKDTRRLDDPQDYVHIEVRSALARGIPVVPLLVGRSAMPREVDLPDGLKELAYRNAAVVRSGLDFHGQVDRLIRGLEQLLARKQELCEGVRKAARIADEDPRMALGRARMVLELMVRDVYERRFNEPPGPRSLESLVQRLDQEGVLPVKFDVTGILRKLGETGPSHRGETITEGDVHQSLAQLTDILKWYFEVEQPDALGQRPTRRGKPETSRIEITEPPRIAVVPKGLRSFDANDSDFFLQLLPGPRDKDGLPESLRFWKHRIEACDELAFTVGVLYGPSGGGKSSLVKAGLLPRLADHVVSVYIEATAEETEARLLRGLRKRFPGLTRELDLTETLASLRQGQALVQGQHVLVVLDQFEQWLHARRREPDSELARALRQCDGEHVQCIVMVRDDFWVALSRFMNDLHIEILQGRNAALVDLFDPIHASKVLAEFGKAYGRLPQDDGALTRDQENFLLRTTKEVEQDGRVIPVRLTLFAEMVKGRPWSMATLKDVGGTQGIGVAFLEEMFNSAALKGHHKAAQGVLKALLPENGTGMKGHMRSQDDLAVASGYGSRPRELDNLLRTLDHDVRLITPTNPEESETEGMDQPVPTGRYYQLTHDYLVPSIRDWLTRKQRETRRGRADLRLAERAALWNAKPENRRLPSVLEWTDIRLLTKKREWTEPQRRMMRQAGHLHGVRGLGLAILIALTTWGGIESYGNLQASALVGSLKSAGTAEVLPIVKDLSVYRRWAVLRLTRMLQESDDQSRDHLHASLALLEVDPSQVDYLSKQLLRAVPPELPILRTALQPHRSQLTPGLWSELRNAKVGDPSLLASAGALALYDPETPSWMDQGDKVAQALATVSSRDLGPWLEVLHPVRITLKSPLARIFRDKGRSETVRSQATDILADYAKDDPELLADLLMDSDPDSFETLFLVVDREEVRARAYSVSAFQAELRKDWATIEKGANSEQAKESLAQRQARAAIALIRLGHIGEEIWRHLEHSADPRLRSYIVNSMKPLGGDPRILADALDHVPAPAQPTPAKGQQFTDAVLFHPETSKRRALILALGTYGVDNLSQGASQPLIAKLLDLYENDPDAGIHGAAEWVLRQWKQELKLLEIDRRLQAKEGGNRRWFVNSHGQTFAIVEGPVKFRMGSPPDEPGRLPSEPLDLKTIPYRFAIANKEVTIEQGRPYTDSELNLSADVIQRFGLTPDRPVVGVSWFAAAAYCNWLSEKEGLPEDQWCYLANSQGEYAEGMRIKANSLELKGYRLPTEVEWEYACRAGAMTSRYYGGSNGFLDRYAWYIANSGDEFRPTPCGRMMPNDLGLFDMLGNEFEWCQEPFNEGASDRIVDGGLRLLRGGAFDGQPASVRSAYRGAGAPSGHDINTGFRLARTYVATP
jgi:formylglycine-generating enzyme required for sulfatase activity